MAGIREDPREDHRKEPRDTLHAVDPAGEANAEPQTETQAQAQDPQPSPWPRALLTGVLGAVIVSLVVLAFLWPSFASEPKNLPVQVVASEQEYEQFTAQTEKASAAQGTALPFSFVRADSRDAAVDAITHRDAYGAFVLPSGPDGQMEVLTAKAANTQVATIITSAAQNMAKGQAAQIPADAPAEQRTAAMDKALEGPTITDVAPLPEADPNGTGLALSSLPLTIGGIIGGVVTAFTLKGTWRRLAGVLTYTVVGSLALYLVLDVWFEFLPAPFALEWLAIGMSLLATASVIVGLHSLVGAPGIGIGAILTMFIGNPLSGTQIPGEFLPWKWGEIGQYFVPGATGSLLRDISYFPDASTSQYWITLAVWIAFGLGFIIFAHRNNGGHGVEHNARVRAERENKELVDATA